MSNGISQNGVGSHHGSNDVAELDKTYPRSHQLFPPDYITDPQLQKVSLAIYLFCLKFLCQFFLMEM